VNDAIDWNELLTKNGSKGGMLLDERATRNAVIGQLTDLVVSTRFNDIGVFTYSGHGTWVPDENSEESDGRDEALVPVDYDPEGFITDDVLSSIIKRYRSIGAKILFISDSCYSGTVERLFQSDIHPDAMARRPRFLPPAVFLNEDQIAAAKAVENLPANEYSKTGAALLSGCREDEVSWDADFNGQPNGAMTRAAIDTFVYNRPKNLAAWRKQIQAALLHDQHPQVQGTYLQRRRTRYI